LRQITAAKEGNRRYKYKKEDVGVVEVLDIFAGTAPLESSQSRRK
jgi:hypothetical protein